MANNNQRTSVDKFGNTYAVVGCKDKKGTGFPKGYIEIKGQLYKLEPSDSQKDGVACWIRVTKMNNRKSGGGL
ncbi:hypothetical protein BXY85_3749 [Roseivirga pacifica]|uniref:Uncharacterized protein n=1 Tax=Roseivirga pacifica TaxID=1267423 RepID=A0A1I0Q901_9BACT|nr:hypothetical protein [Roseivirga pacifica]RKQ43130.1 hypothetical protein BXY85_3749 [Roseivirga pacifica]SEW23503.1 hypothetical protein SAMN05216290_2126 [Roseivirga pacifica]